MSIPEYSVKFPYIQFFTVSCHPYFNCDKHLFFLQEGKTLLVPLPRLAEGIIMRVCLPENANRQVSWHTVYTQ